MTSTAFAHGDINSNNIAGATTTSDTITTATSSPAVIELSLKPLWQERSTNTGVNPINETHIHGGNIHWNWHADSAGHRGDYHCDIAFHSALALCISKIIVKKSWLLH
jgi:hypothetical protein